LVHFLTDFTWFAQTEFLDPNHFPRGHGIVHLGHLYVGWSQTSHFVSIKGRVFLSIIISGDLSTPQTTSR
jgi:hypothetical protein